MHEQLIPISSNNISAYKYLYAIEVGLRELVIHSLSLVDTKWWKTRLPGDLLKKFKDAKQIERNTKWCTLIPHHPLYYLDFPDLRKIIERNDNWKDVFQDYFGDKEVLLGNLRGLEPIRNKIAHNRQVSDEDIQLLGAAYGILTNALGEETLLNYLDKQTIATDIFDKLTTLKQLAINCFNNCIQYQPISRLSDWMEIEKLWWFDAAYLGNDISPIERFFHSLIEYDQLPRNRGAGYVIEGWIKNNELKPHFSNAMNTFSLILDQS